ncbi:MAG: indolepyruvate ferredoxin oxidoreductase subunit alpha [Candidatus Methanomethylophilaceae archaeon]|nr:indolepyruvate ferredoxin oxidoreductase subunit alpha [Candidatus Methanomethylophilaceae archaeon]
MTDILEDSGKLLVLGNEAITRGLIEAGVRFASTYPGTPSSEIGGLLEKIAEKVGMYFEYSTNEKVALEAASGAAAAGIRSFAFMKHVGLNVASDPLMTLAYAGVDGGMVIMTADDPSAHSSQNEQDNRYYALLSLLPMLEPSTPSEAKEMVKDAFDLSERLHSPVLFRTTTRINHARGIIEMSSRKDTVQKSDFKKDPRRYVNVPANARLNRLKLLERLAEASRESEESPLNYVTGDSGVGIITSGVSYGYAQEWLDDVSILKLGFTHPLPEKMIARFLQEKEMVIVVEELEPYLEDQVLRIARQNGIDTPIFGKRTGHLPRPYEYSPDVIKGLRSLVPITRDAVPLEKPDIVLPNRPPMLCAGCPHRGTFYAVKKAVGKDDVIYSSDIGCYTLGIQPPYHTADFILCMGGGVGAAGGFSEATDQKVVAFIGDSTFFHTGIPPLINAVFNQHRFTVVIMDNRATAMTGHQPHPGTGRVHGGRQTNPLEIEPIVRACGVSFVETVDPADIKNTTDVMRRAMEHDGVSVVITKHPCPLDLKKKKKLNVSIYTINQEKCIRCYTCVQKFACPAIYRQGDEVFIDPILCIGCGMCTQICPKGAMEEMQ